ncbi:MAG TPA: OsmC family protein [Actinomycetes bacterium]|nr:OsmC family protein [Actinomycetes bacterium]
MAVTEPEREAELVADATATIGTDRYHVELQAGQHALAADEPADHGGADSGPPPFGLLLSGLGACTAITLRMYADRKGWPLEGVDVELAYTVRDRATRWIDRAIILRGPLDEGQRARLAEIAEKTPVTRAIRGGTEIRTTVDRRG